MASPRITTEGGLQLVCFEIEEPDDHGLAKLLRTIADWLDRQDNPRVVSMGNYRLDDAGRSLSIVLALNHKGGGR